MVQVQQLVPSFDHFRVRFEGEAIKDAMFVDDQFRLLFQVTLSGCVQVLSVNGLITVAVTLVRWV